MKIFLILKKIDQSKYFKTCLSRKKRLFNALKCAFLRVKTFISFTFEGEGDGGDDEDLSTGVGVNVVCIKV